MKFYFNQKYLEEKIIFNEKASKERRGILKRREREREAEKDKEREEVTVLNTHKFSFVNIKKDKMWNDYRAYVFHIISNLELIYSPWGCKGSAVFT